MGDKTHTLPRATRRRLKDVCGVIDNDFEMDLLCMRFCRTYFVSVLA